MALDDYLEPEVAIAVAVTAAVASPPVRKAIRKGAVYGLAGLLIARDKVMALASEAKIGIKGAQKPEPAAPAAATEAAAPS